MLNSKLSIDFTTCKSKNELLEIIEGRPTKYMYKYSQGIKEEQCTYSYLDTTGYNVVTTPSLTHIKNIESGRYFDMSRKDFSEIRLWEKTTPSRWPGNTVGDAVERVNSKSSKYISTVINKLESRETGNKEEISILSAEKERIRSGHVKVYWSDDTFGRSQARRARRDANSRYRLFEVYNVTEGKITEGTDAGLEVLSLDTATKSITYTSDKIEYFVTAPGVSVDRGMAISQPGGGRIRGR
ncbi:hypothetical protein GGQ03_003069 [Salinibacter ruber]|uniref:hypothetical protein n=1 Tax=Salinibacter ruber TaxID=146919 RepID=UPI002169FF8D|nr:hypothetical protein [Salinibacter ruber]MCS4155764.1 hypothetical protein [Salinibacter ruber]